MEPMSDIDKAKFKELFENGLLTARPPEVWLPQKSKDGEWKNHFIGSTGVPMHLSGGWMINESTGSLKQVDIDDIDFSPTNISDYITGVSTGRAQSQDASQIDSMKSILNQLGYEFEEIENKSGRLLAVKGGISIQWDGSSMRLSTMHFGYDPKLVMTEGFSQVLEERSSDGFTVVLNHVPELDDNYEETGVIGESYLEIFTDIPNAISKDGFTRLIQDRAKEVAEFIKLLKNYEFDQPTIPTNRTNKDYFTFNVHSSALVVGQTGTGKTELVRQHIRRLEQAFTPDQMKYVIFDLKQVEFDSKHADGAKQEYLYSPIRFGKPEDMDYLEELADLAEQRAKEEKPEPMIFIYIEECDMAAQYPGRFHNAVIRINENAKRANMKLMFSTSRPSPDIIPSDFRDSFDLILSGILASEADEKTLGMPGATRLNQYEFLVKEARESNPIV